MQLASKVEGIYLMSNKSKTGDFYWAYADILRGIGINESTYDQRIMAFMALKLLADNKKVKFNFDFRNQFGLSDSLYRKYKALTTQQTLINLVSDITRLGCNLSYFEQDKKYNPDQESRHILHYINHKRTFSLIDYIEELEPHYLEMVLDIYREKADFTDYPKEQYKDLYEVTIARMKRLAGDLTGQHFTQKSVIHLMCHSALAALKESSSEVLAIYDPACGTASMLMESAEYFAHHIDKPIEVFGQEYHGQTWFLAKMFLEISGIRNTIAYGNTLTDPAFQKINGSNSFDYIIANPPFGMDWKHDYDEVIANMEKGGRSSFLVVKDDNGNIVTPKKSDGQFLFMLHILNLLQTSKKSGKHAKAAIISSGNLGNAGNSSESKIRRAIFDLQMLEALVEQPKAMFTNTDITSSIWFFDSSHESSSVQCIKVDNDIQPMFSAHPMPKDKMKNAYSGKNITKILTYFSREREYIAKAVNVASCNELNVAQVVGRKPVEHNKNLFELMDEIKRSMKALSMEADGWMFK